LLSSRRLEKNRIKDQLLGNHGNCRRNCRGMGFMKGLFRKTPPFGGPGYFVLLLLPVLLGPALLSAQAAEDLDQVLASSALSYGQAAYFILRSASSGEDGGEPDTPAGAFDRARGNGWVPKKAVENDTASLGAVSLLIMRAFDFKGGFMYSLFHSPRHAARELVYLKILQEYGDPGRPVSGDRFFQILSGALARSPWALLDEIPQGVEGAAWSARDGVPPEDAINARLTGLPIQFAPDSVDFLPSEQDKLEEIGRLLQALPRGKVLVTGHTAIVGTEAGREAVSLWRAQAVADYLAAQGLRRPDEIMVEGLGAERPLAPRDSDQSANRRVEITVVGDNAPASGGLEPSGGADE
jgi:outer membrane protein OmpA-like peptidoglycan-associated protein